MVLTMCTFYMGEALSVAAESTPAEIIVPIYTWQELLDNMANSANKGKTLQFQNDIKATDWTFEPADLETMTVTGTKGDTVVTVGVGKDNFTDGNAISVAEDTAYARTLVDGVNVDGNGFAITGMIVEKSTSAGDVFNFIIEVGPNSTLKNITVKNSLIAIRGTSAARLLATTVHGKVINCKSENTATVAVMSTSDNKVEVGGLLGNLGMKGSDAGSDTLQGIYEGIQGKFTVTSAGLVDGCVSNTNVFAYSNGFTKEIFAGGVVARISNNGGGIIRNCANYGTVTAVGAAYGVGGIIGLAELGRGSNPIGYERSLQLYNCANYGKIDTSHAATNELLNRGGGVIGYLDTCWSTGGQANIFNCYNSGEVTHGAAYAFIGFFNAANGSKWLHGTSADNGGYAFGARLNGGTALNFSKSATAPEKKQETHFVKLGYHSTATKTGSFNNAGCYAAPGNVYGNAMLGSTDVTTILNKASKYFEGAKPWKVGEDGNPEIDFASENAPVVITTAEQLNELRILYNLAGNLGSDVKIKATLGADVDLNPGFTFGYDAEKKAGTVTKDATTYYLGYGLNALATGKFYTFNEEAATEVAAPAGLTPWSMFLSSGRPEKVSLMLDGAGHTISGLYINRAGFIGFACNAWDIHFSNLTLDGLILDTNGTKGCGAFMGYANNDCSIVDCVNKVTVLSDAIDTQAFVGGFVGGIGVDRAADQLYERMPNRINKIIGCVNEGVVAVASDVGTGDKIGGIAGYVTNSAEIAYCTNVGSILSSSAGKLAGIAIAELGTNLPVAASNNRTTYGSDTSLWTASGGTQGNIGAPYQTVVRIYGNSNSGTVQNVSGGKVASALIYNPCWISDGAWGLVSTTYQYAGPHAVLPTEAIVQYNVGIKTGNTTNAVIVEDGSNYYAYVWKNGVDLRATARNAALRIQNNYVSTVNATNLNAQIAKLYPVAAAHNIGYMMWMDYDYSNGGVPHAIKIPSATVYSGLTVASATGEANTEIGVSNAAALRFIRDTANYLTSQKVVIAGTEINGIVAAHDLAVSKDIAADGTVSATDISTFNSVNNAVNYYLNKASNNSDWGITRFTGVRIKLLDNIDLGGEKWVPITDDIAYRGSTDTNVHTPIYSFAGIFEGNNKTISNFTNSRESGYGFIGSIDGGTVRNLNFSNAKITGTKYVSILTGYANGTIKNVKFDDTCSVTGVDNVGAAVPWQQGGAVNDCVNYATINATGGTAGGFIASANGSFANNKNYATVTSTGGTNIGGIVGAATSTGTGEIGRNVNYGKINAANSDNVGGITGRYQDHNVNTLYVKDSANHGEVIGKNYVGGIIGNTEINLTAHPKIPQMSGLVNEGKITGNNNVGGIAGRLYQAIGEGLVNNGNVKGNQNVGGIVGNLYLATCVGLVNNAEVNGVKYLGGIVGLANNATLKKSENTGLVKNIYQVPADFGNALGNVDYSTGGIAGRADSSSKVIQNVNRGEVNSENWKHAAGIVANVQGTNTLIEGNVNYGTVKAKSNSAGIVSVLESGGSATTNAVVKGNVNFGTYINGGKGNRAGIVAWKTRGASEVAYNVNFGKDQSVLDSASGSIIATVNCNTAKLGTDVYGNINATGNRLFGNAEAWYTNNYAVGATNKCTLIGGKPVTLDQFKFGEVADIVNNLSYEADNFLSSSPKYLYGANGNERPASVEFWDGNMKNLTADKFVAPIGLEADYMVQEIGVDEYPLPKLAAEIIYADREMTVPAGPATVAPAAPATEGTEQFIGYIDYDRNIYKAGAEANGKYLYPVSVDFYTAYGAGVRTTSPTGIRYQTLVKDNLDMLPESFVTNFGTIVLPYSYVEQMMAEANAATFNKKVDVAQIIGSGVKHIDIANNGWADPTVTGVEVADGYKTYMGSLVNIKDSNLTRDFTGISYLKVTYADGEVSYITADWQTAKAGAEFVDGVSYSKDANARSIVTIADLALKDQNAGFSDTVRAALQAYIDRAEELGLLA